MQGGCLRRLTLVFTAATLAIGAGLAVAGVTPDPDTNDLDRGTTGGLRYASDSEAFNLDNAGFASDISGCGPDDWHIVGGGVKLAGPSAKNRTFATTTPYDWLDLDTVPEDGWRVAGYGGAAGNLTAFSICQEAPQPNYVGGAELPDSPGNVRKFKQACGAGNGRVVGGGGSISTAQSFQSQSYPFDGPDGDSKPDDGWAARFYDTVGGIGGARLRAVCRTGEEVSYRTATDTARRNGGANATAHCGAGTHVSGGGAKIVGPGAQVHLADSYPADDGDANATPDDGWKGAAYNDSSRRRKLTVYAICLG
jgi:hypothetical protein